MKMCWLWKSCSCAAFKLRVCAETIHYLTINDQCAQPTTSTTGLPFLGLVVWPLSWGFWSGVCMMGHRCSQFNRNWKDIRRIQFFSSCMEMDLSSLSIEHAFALVVRVWKQQMCQFGADMWLDWSWSCFHVHTICLPPLVYTSEKQGVVTRSLTWLPPKTGWRQSKDPSGNWSKGPHTTYHTHHTSWVWPVGWAAKAILIPVFCFPRNCCFP